MARRKKAATVRAYRSKSRANRRYRVVQAKVRSTIQRLGRTTELMSLGALDDLEGPGTGVGGGQGGPRSLIAGIGEDALDEREGATGLA